jgi:hypothetical protein
MKILYTDKTNKLKPLLIGALLICTFILSSCKKEDKGDVVFLGNGSVSGTIKGVKADNNTLDEKFSLNTYLDIYQDQQYEITQQGYQFVIYFSDPTGAGIYLKFTLTSATDTNPVISKFGIDYYKYSENETFYFWMNNNNTFTISDFSFDVSTGKVKCKLTATGNSNSTGKNATVEANYEVIVKKIVK